ncbi:uncharacterized protein Z518_00268 [Rhinocladiella mackenziei CBS 650.93]|uniref:Zn(2)-C6 fungal-type domain-containing protein n=1 Tax=Rhinocladiella mackenziei CBS 650.93 TaxID=1442369 RepID=A0A0D2IT33_9EURO|nr:uncharacterized protein Z518_00268 [Rhinocladiella mackenziei CBS 650.93]KIX09189.1 hypothetical protein Z518_00268 [Rhinocladiella mackenziei CBS 650.93]
MDPDAADQANTGENPAWNTTIASSREATTAPSKKRKQNADGDTASSPPPRRVSKACDVCRLAKVRCGGEKPQCRRCVEAELFCSYDSPLRRRGPEKGINYKINQRMSNLEKLLAGTLDEVRRNFATSNNKQSDTGNPMNMIQWDERGGTGPRSLTESMYVNHQTEGLGESSPPSLHKRPEPAGSERSPEGCSSSPVGAGHNDRSILTTAQSDESVASTAIPLPALGTYYGSPHTDKSVASRGMSAHQSNGIYPTITTTEARPMPDMDIVLHLIDKFFIYLHGQQYTFLHRESLVDDYLGGAAAPELIFALCAVAARFSDHSSFRASLPYKAGEDFAAEALDIIVRNLNRPTMATVQALLLLSLHAAGCMKGAQAWILGGMAFRICDLLRLDKDDSSTEPSNWHEAEMRRRTFWYAFTVDQFSSAGSGLPWSVSSDRPLPRLPVSEKLFLQGRPAITPRFTDGETEHDENLGCVAYLARLAELWGLVALYVSDPDREIEPDQPSSRYRWLKNQLRNWHSRLPDRLQYSAKTLCSAISHGEGGVLAFMHMLYHASCSFVEQAVLAHFSHLPVTFLREVAICMDKHAHVCVDIYTKTTTTYSTYLYTPLTAYLLLLSGIILGRQSFATHSEAAASACKRYADAENGIKRLMSYWAPAERYLTTLNAYYDSLKSLTGKRQNRQNHHLDPNNKMTHADSSTHAETPSLGELVADPPSDIVTRTLSSTEAAISQPGAAHNRSYPPLESTTSALPFDDPTLDRMLRMDMWTFPNDAMFPSTGHYPWLTGDTDILWNSNRAFSSFFDP